MRSPTEAPSSATTPTTATAGRSLLAADEPPPLILERPEGTANFVIAVDHAGWMIPRRLDDLGLPQSELRRHIAWDIGALAVARQVSILLDAPLVAQRYSRLVIDCNRDPQVASSIATVSEFVEIPGNRDLGEADIAARRAEIFDPYHAAIGALLDARATAGRKTILVAQHSMTNVYKAVRREMHAAILYNRDRRFAGLLLERLRRERDLIVADNQPYFVSDETDYTVPRHGEERGLPHVEIEIRQDLVSDPAGQTEWAQRLAAALRECERTFFQSQS
jgi:predicted N-formylglutamate amidohydrolase